MSDKHIAMMKQRLDRLYQYVGQVNGLELLEAENIIKYISICLTFNDCSYLPTRPECKAAYIEWYKTAEEIRKLRHSTLPYPAMGS